MLRDLDENLMRNIVDMADGELSNFMETVNDDRGLEVDAYLIQSIFNFTTFRHISTLISKIHNNESNIVVY